MPYIGREFNVSFEFFLTKYSEVAHAIQNMIHFTPGADYTAPGDRNPAIFIYGATKITQIWLNGLIHDVKFESGKLPAGKWSIWEISQTLTNDKAGRQVDGGKIFISF